MPSSGVCGDGHEEDTRIKTLDGSKRNTLSAIKAATGPSSGNPTMRRGRRRRCGCYPPLVHPSHDTLRSEAKPTRMIPRLKPTSQIAKGPICEIHFGVLRFLWHDQDGRCPVCCEKITRLTGWRLHYRVPLVMGGSKGATNGVLLHPECRDKVHRLHLSVSKPRLPQKGDRRA